MPVPGKFFNRWPLFDLTKNYITDCITKKCLEQYLDYLYLYHLSSLVQSEDLRKQKHSLHLLLWSTWSTLTSRFMMIYEKFSLSVVNFAPTLPLFISSEQFKAFGTCWGQAARVRFSAGLGAWQSRTRPAQRENVLHITVFRDFRERMSFSNDSNAFLQSEGFRMKPSAAGASFRSVIIRYHKDLEGTCFFLWLVYILRLLVQWITSSGILPASRWICECCDFEQQPNVP